MRKIIFTFFFCLQICSSIHTAFAYPLSARNDGNSIISSLPEDSLGGHQFQPLLDAEGNIVYFFNMGGAMGFCMGRYHSSEKKWELWTPAGWSSQTDAIAEPIGQAFFSTSDYSNNTQINSSNYQFVQLTENNSEIFALVSGKSKLGKSFFDVHGSPFNFLFNGSQWSSYDGSAYNPNMLRVSPLPIWNEGAHFHFATNEHGQGILIARGQPYLGAPTHFYAARFDKDRGVQNGGNYWSAWRRIGQNRDWMANSASLEPLLTGLPNMEAPLVGYAGLDQSGHDIYLFVGEVMTQTRAFKYNDTTKTWFIWNGTWQFDSGQSNFQSILNAGYQSIDPPGRLVKFGSEVLYIYQKTIGAQTSIWYAKTDGSLDYNWTTTNTSVPNVGPLLFNGNSGDQRQQKSIAITRNRQGEIMIYFLRRNTETDTATLHSIRYNGSWQAPSGPLFSTHPAAQNIKLLGAIFYQNPSSEVPIVFIKNGSDYLAISEDAELWQNEHPIRFVDAIPQHRTMDVSRFNVSDQFLNVAVNPANGDRPAYDDASAFFLAKDLEGYLYSPQSCCTSVIIHPPGAVLENEKKFWGQFWETTFFPGAIGVDNSRNFTYFVDYLVGGGSGSGNYGQLRWLPKSYREDFIYAGEWTFPENNGAIPSLSTAARFATGLLIDEPRGYLYLGSGLTGEIMKFDISQVTLQNAPMRRSNLLSNLSGPTGFAQDENGFFYVVESLANRVSVFDAGGIFLRSFGNLGRGHGEFLYPTQIAYSEQYHIIYVADPMNERLQVFNKQGEFITQWNSWQSPNVHDNFSAIGGIIAEGNRLYVSTQSYAGNNKIRIFQIHDSPPRAASLILPSNNILIAGTPVNFRADDDWGIIRIDLMVDGDLINSQEIDHIRSLNGSISWDSRRVSEGLHSFEIIATDAGGNSSSSGPVTLNVRYRSNLRRTLMIA